MGCGCSISRKEGKTKMRKNMWILLICLIILLCGCGKAAENGPTSVAATDTEVVENTVLNSTEVDLTTTESAKDALATAESGQGALLSTNDELYGYMMDKWMEGDISELYAYASDELKALLDAESFSYMFMKPNSTFGNIVEIKNEKVTVSGDIDVHTATLLFENAEANIALYFKNLKITGYNYDVRFVNSFDREYQDGITESYFLLESGDYLLNAVYTHTDKSDAPSVLLIPGSGVSDYNETIGLLPTFEDIALELAERGINTLRFEKRTNRYSSKWTVKSGLDEEDFIDCNAALEWLRNNNETGEIYILGHSLGAQIAVELASQNEVNGLILFNGSARHLAEIAKDQYCELDPANSSYYKQFMDAAMNSTLDTAEGKFYFNCSDYYWADYNRLSTIETLKNIEIPTLIINSRLDRQVKDADIELWQKEFADDDNVSIVIYDDISHFGYKIDALDTSSLYKASAFPDDLADTFAGFCR